MQFRQAEEKDKKAVMELWAEDFESYEPYYSWYFSVIYRSERTFLLEENGKIIAAAQLAPYKMHLQKQTVDINYIVGVITEREYRGRGLGKKLMQELEKEQLRQNSIFSVLYPVCPAFYAGLGYCYGYENNLWNIPIERPRFQQRKGIWQEFSVDEAIPILAGIYQKMTARLNGYIIRSEENWRNFLTEICNDKGHIMIYSENAVPQAYILHLPMEEKLYAREIGFTDPQYFSACLQYIKEHFDNKKMLYYPAPACDLSYLELPLQDGIARRAGSMVRCHNALKALQKLRLPHNFMLKLEIRDKYLHENNIKILLKENNGQVLTENITDKPDIILDIKSFTQLYWGFLSANELLLNGRISAEQEITDKLNMLFPKQNNWLSEQT